MEPTHIFIDLKISLRWLCFWYSVNDLQVAVLHVALLGKMARKVCVWHYGATWAFLGCSWLNPQAWKPVEKWRANFCFCRKPWLDSIPTIQTETYEGGGTCLRLHPTSGNLLRWTPGRRQGVICKRPWERNGLNVWFPKNRHFVSGKVVSVLEPQRHTQDLGSQSSFCGDSWV